MPFECQSCGRREEKRLRRPPDCPTKDLCDLRAVPSAEPPADVSGVPPALESFRKVAQDARAQLADEVAHDEAAMQTPPASPAETAIALPTSAVLIIGRERFTLLSDSLLGRNGSVGFQQMRSDASVSREHARVHYRDGRWSIENVARSNNNVRVNDRVIGFGASCELYPGPNSVVLGERFAVEIVIG